MVGRYYEGFSEGDRIEHDRRRTVSESDNQRFCDMTMNQQPLHLDAEFAAGTAFGERVVNGLYTMSLAVGLTIPETTDGTIVANLSYDDVSHPAPVFHGDTLRAVSTVTNARETSDGDRGVVTMRVETFNQHDELVCSFDRTVLSLKRAAAEGATESESESEKGVGSGSASETGSESEKAAGSESESGPELESESESGPELESESESGPEPESDSD
jgi:acyl dehydratase